MISYALTIVWFMLVFIAFDWGTGNTLLNIIFVLVPLALFFVSGIMFGKFKNKMYMDYDYTLVSGSIRVSKVVKNIKRYFAIKFDASTIEKIGLYGSNTFKKYDTMHGISKYIFTSNLTPAENKSFYYIVAVVDSDRKLMVFECTETFIVNILKFSNKTVLEEEFTKK
jgi:hypothetical protein